MVCFYPVEPSVPSIQPTVFILWAKLYGSQLVEVPVLEDFSVDIGALDQSHDAIVLAALMRLGMRWAC